MANVPEESGDRMRKLFLIVSACLLSAVICVSLVFNSTRQIGFGFLFPALASGLSAVYSEKFHSLVFARYMPFLLSFSTIVFATAFNSSYEVFSGLCCVNIVWCGLFEMGLDLARSEFPFPLPQFYGVIAVNFISHLVKSESVVSSWAYLVPFLLTMAMIQLKSSFANGSARSAGGGTSGGSKEAARARSAGGGTSGGSKEAARARSAGGGTSGGSKEAARARSAGGGTSGGSKEAARARFSGGGTSGGGKEGDVCVY